MQANETSGPAGPPGPKGFQPKHFFKCKECEVQIDVPTGACGQPWISVTSTSNLCQTGRKLWEQYTEYLNPSHPIDENIELSFYNT